MKNFFILLLVFLFVMFSIFIYSKYPVETIFSQKYIPDIPEQKSFSAIMLPYGQWVWQYSITTNDEKIKPKNPQDFILTLTPEGRLTSTTDCNTVSGSYVKNENTINIGPMITTEKDCRGETLESLYITHLSLSSTYEVKDNTLVLRLLNGSGRMVFSQK